MRNPNKYVVAGCLLLTLIMALIVIVSNVNAFPGNENFTAAVVNDSRVDPNQPVLWNVSVLNNITFWVNVTVTYNTTAYGPYNVSLTGPGNAVLSHKVPNTNGNYTVYITSKGNIQNITYTKFIIDHYLIDLNAAFTETEEGFNALITATGSSTIDGHAVAFDDALNVDGVGAMTWTNYTDNFYGQTTSAIPATTTYDTVTSFLESTYGITSAEINTTVTITWTEGTLDRLQVNFLTGDWVGAIIEETTQSLGGMFTYTVLMAILSVGIYNVSGAYATIFSWIIGWSTWSGVTHGGAQLLGILFIVLGFGLALTKVALDRRRS